MLSWKTAACLAAGNTVVIKPAQVGAGMARGPRAWRAWAGAGHRPLRPPHAPPPLTGREERALQVTAACEARLSGQTWCVWVSGLGQAGWTRVQPLDEHPHLFHINPPVDPRTQALGSEPGASTVKAGASNPKHPGEVPMCPPPGLLREAT